MLASCFYDPSTLCGFLRVPLLQFLLPPGLIAAADIRSRRLRVRLLCVTLPAFGSSGFAYELFFTHGAAVCSSECCGDNNTQSLLFLSSGSF